MKGRAVAVTVAAVLALAGCIDSSTTVIVGTDGSGTIEKTVILSNTLVEFFQGMGMEGETGSIAEGMLNEDGLRAAAARMGSGVAFVSAQKLSTDKGRRV